MRELELEEWKKGKSQAVSGYAFKKFEDIKQRKEAQHQEKKTQLMTHNDELSN